MFAGIVVNSARQGKTRRGDRRCRYKGHVGMHRWVGLGVIAGNLINIGRAMKKQTAP
jgi:IS5 family transposase